MDRKLDLDLGEQHEAIALARRRCLAAYTADNSFEPACVRGACLPQFCSRVRFAALELNRMAAAEPEPPKERKKPYGRRGGVARDKTSGSRAAVEPISEALLADEQGEQWFMAKASLRHGRRHNHGQIIGWGCYWKRPFNT